MEAQDHQDLPFEQVVEIVQPPRQLNRTPLFQVMLGWQEGSVGEPEFAGLEVRGVEVAYEVAKFDLQLDLGEQDGQIVGSLSYATDLFKEESICRHRGYLLSMLEAMAADQKQAVCEIDLVYQRNGDCTRDLECDRGGISKALVRAPLVRAAGEEESGGHSSGL